MLLGYHVMFLGRSWFSRENTNGPTTDRPDTHRAWETKQRAEASIERSLESIGLIDEQTDHDHDNGDENDADNGFRSHDSLFR